MWGKNKAAQEAQVNAIRNRFATVLGLTLNNQSDDEATSGLTSQALEEPSAPVITATTANNESFVGGIDPQDPPASEAPESVTPTTLNPGVEYVQKSAEAFEPIEFEGPEIQIQPDITRIEAPSPAVQGVPLHLSHRTEEALPGPLRSSGQTVPNGLLQHRQPLLPGAATRAEDRPDASDAFRSNIEAALAELTRKSEGLIERQARLLEDMLTRAGDKTVSQAQASVHRTVSRFETYFAQAEEMKSTLEATLTRFGERTEESAKTQAKYFEEEIARISEQAISQAQESLRGEVIHLREAATHSFQHQLASAGESLERRLKESFEVWSKSQLEIIQQQVGNLSADLLSRVRIESEERIVEAMQGKLQKVTNELRSALERAFE
jgi:hypothetical protein